MSPEGKAKQNIKLNLPVLYYWPGKMSKAMRAFTLSSLPYKPQQQTKGRKQGRQAGAVRWQHKALFATPSSTPKVNMQKDKCKQVAFRNSTAKIGSFEIIFFSSTLRLHGMKPLVQRQLVAKLVGNPVQRLITSDCARRTSECAIFCGFLWHFAH